MTGALLVVFSNPTEGEEAEYHRWYDEIHVPDMCAVPGVISGRRYELKSPHEGRRFVAVYELDAEDPDAVIAEVRRRAGSERLRPSTAIDRDSIISTIFMPLP